MEYVGWSDILSDHIDYKYYYLELLADCFRKIVIFEIQLLHFLIYPKNSPIFKITGFWLGVVKVVT